MSKGILHSFYNSKEWLAFRYDIIDKRGTICQDCNKKIFESRDIQIHHTPIELTEDNFKDVNISLNPDNVRLICSRCHNKAHGRFVGGIKKKPRGIYLVCGAPLSGKTSYVIENMTQGDMVVDIDRLYEAVSLQDRYDKPDNLKYNIFAIKNTLIDNIKTRYGNFKSAWVVGGYPNKVERERLATELGAQVILIECSKEECIKRLENSNDYRQRNKTEWIRYIDDYFEKFSK